jgi:hypothetical protein
VAAGGSNDDTPLLPEQLARSPMATVAESAEEKKRTINLLKARPEILAPVVSA